MTTQFIEDTFAWKNAFHKYPHPVLTLRCLDTDGKVQMSQDDAEKLVAFLTERCSCYQYAGDNKSCPIHGKARGPEWTPQAFAAGEEELEFDAAQAVKVLYPEYFDEPSDEETPLI